MTPNDIWLAKHKNQSYRLADDRMAVLTERIWLDCDRSGRNNLHRTMVRCTGRTPSGNYRYCSRRRPRIASFVCWRWPCMSKLLPPTLTTFPERYNILSWSRVLFLSVIPCVLIDLTHLPICVNFSVCLKCWRERDFVVSFFALLASPAAILVVVFCCHFLENADRCAGTGSMQGRESISKPSLSTWSSPVRKGSLCRSDIRVCFWFVYISLWWPRPNNVSDLFTV